jgi:DNA modification methylase
MSSGTSQLRCTPSHEYVLWFSRVRPKWNVDNVKVDSKTPAGKLLRPPGGAKYNQNPSSSFISTGKRTRLSVWETLPSRKSTNHIATFPKEIPRICILGCTDPGDIVVDCFAGSRTIEEVAMELGRIPDPSLRAKTTQCRILYGINYQALV